MKLNQCAICKEGYYKDELICKECISICSTCLNDYQCTECYDEYLLL